MTIFRQPQQTDSLRQTIEQQIACTEALLTTLEQERQALVDNELPRLEQVSTDKIQSVTALQALGQQLDRLRDAGPDGKLDTLIQRSGDAVRERWQQLLGLAARCQKANLANGALLEERQSQVRWALGQMLGVDNTPRLYGPGGSTSAGGGSRKLARA